MSDSERVRMLEPLIDGLMHCLHDTDPGQAVKCEGCPYRANEETDWSYSCSHALRDDAMELLEPMRARSLSLDDAIRVLNVPRWAEWWMCTSEGCYVRCAGWVIVKDLFGSDPLFVTFTDCFGDHRYLKERYNKGWRMWSAEPTESQREAWEWERDNEPTP